MATNLDNKIKSCCSVDDRFIFFESDNIRVHDDPANNTTTTCSILGKGGIVIIKPRVAPWGHFLYYHEGYMM